jgi:phospholipase C
MKKIAVLAASVLAVVVAVTSASASAPRKDLKNFQHVWVVMMENTSEKSLIGNDNAPYINELADTVGLATNYYGITHPSQPNYVAITSGSTNGVANDNDTTVNATNIVDQLESHGKTWRDYQQSLSLCNGNKLAHSCGGPGNQFYERSRPHGERRRPRPAAKRPGERQRARLQLHRSRPVPRYARNRRHAREPVRLLQ